MSEKNKITEEGQIAVVHYVGRIAEGDEKGEVFDTTDVDVAHEEGIYHSNRHYKPLQVEVGEGEVVKGIEDELFGMEKGDEKTVVVEPSRAFGERDEDEVVEFPREMFDEPEEGALVKTDDMQTGWVKEVDGETVTIDFNHELAGTRVEFEIRLLDVLGEKRELGT